MTPSPALPNYLHVLLLGFRLMFPLTIFVQKSHHHHGKAALVKSSQSSPVKYALFRHKKIQVSRPHMGDMASEKCITSKT